jgi:hypothetical protein
MVAVIYLKMEMDSHTTLLMNYAGSSNGNNFKRKQGDGAGSKAVVLRWSEDTDDFSLGYWRVSGRLYRSSK